MTLLVHLLISSTFLTCQLPAQAVVPTTNSTSSATGDGVTNTFTFTFELLQASDMTAYVAGVLQTQNVAYIVTPTGGSYPCTGGTITFQATFTPANSAAILMARQLTLIQSINLPVEGSLPSSTLQTVFDRACMQIQQINTNQLLSLQLPITSIGVNTALPTPVALNLIGWDNLAQNVVNYTPQAVVANVTGVGFGNMVGPATSTIGNMVVWNNTTGTLTKNGIAPPSISQYVGGDGAGNFLDKTLPNPVYTNLRTYLNTGAPFSDGSSTGNATVFVGPLPTGKFVTVDDGSGNLSVVTLTEISSSIAGLTISTAYSEFLVNTAGVETLEFDSWSGINTPLTYGKDAAGRLCKSGSTNKLLIAELYCSAAGKVSNWTGERSLVNIYNQQEVPVLAQIPVSSWTYGTGTIRASDANTTNGQGRVGIFIGSNPQTVNVTFVQNISNPGSGSNPAYAFALGLDSTTAYSSFVSSSTSVGVSTSVQQTCTINYAVTPSTGSHFIQMLENAIGGVATATILGNSANAASGLTGTVNN